MEHSPTPSTRSLEGVKEYQYGLIDPRPIPDAKTANDKLFENPHGVLGIEVTIPAYALRCTLGNIDPQHTDGNKDLAAIELAQTCEIPPSEATMVTVRADLDALGSMALLEYRANGGEITPKCWFALRQSLRRINLLAEDGRENQNFQIKKTLGRLPEVHRKIKVLLQLPLVLWILKFQLLIG